MITDSRFATFRRQVSQFGRFQLTLTVAVPTTELSTVDLAVITTVPRDTPVTTPDELTVPTAAFADDHDTVLAWLTESRRRFGPCQYLPAALG